MQVGRDGFLMDMVTETEKHQPINQNHIQSTQFPRLYRMQNQRNQTHNYD
jgi:hypothetical protein